MTEPKFPILFRTLFDGIVVLDREGDFKFVASCDPCFEGSTGGLEAVRTWANTHAGICRAVPRS
jgi:hypothetical protein